MHMKHENKLHTFFSSVIHSDISFVLLDAGTSLFSMYFGKCGRWQAQKTFSGIWDYRQAYKLGTSRQSVQRRVSDVTFAIPSKIYALFQFHDNENFLFLRLSFWKFYSIRVLNIFFPMWRKYQVPQIYFFTFSVHVMESKIICKIIHTTFASYKYWNVRHACAWGIITEKGINAL